MSNKNEKVAYELGNNNNNNINNNASAADNNSDEEEDLQKHKKCQSIITDLLSDDKVKYMLIEMAKIGCKLPVPFFSCRKCDDSIHGGYVPGYNPQFDEEPSVASSSSTSSQQKHVLPSNHNNSTTKSADDYVDPDYKGPKIILCENKITPYKFFYRDIVIHELVHAFDDCRSKINTRNCLQHACTEIRASRLSGECKFLKEALRLNINVAGQLEVSKIKKKTKILIKNFINF